jgi:hypothetical protein
MTIAMRASDQNALSFDLNGETRTASKNESSAIIVQL